LTSLRWTQTRIPTVSSVGKPLPRPRQRSVRPLHPIPPPPRQSSGLRRITLPAVRRSIPPGAPLLAHHPTRGGARPKTPFNVSPNLPHEPRDQQKPRFSVFPNLPQESREAAAHRSLLHQDSDLAHLHPTAPGSKPASTFLRINPMNPEPRAFSAANPVTPPPFIFRTPKVMARCTTTKANHPPPHPARQGKTRVQDFAEPIP
jgi:hypothetical protein